MEKVSIILVIAGLRPATILEFEMPVTSNSFEVEKELSDMVQPIRELLERNGLAFEVSNVDISASQGVDQKSFVCHLFVGREAGVLSRLVSAWQVRNTAEIGRLLGFPITAVEGFVASLRDKEALKELPTDSRKEPWAKFLQYRISKNWEEEVKTSQSWANAIKKLAPHLYNTIVEGNSN